MSPLCVVCCARGGVGGVEQDNINKDFKYVFLAANSRFKGESDVQKYEKARTLKVRCGAVLCCAVLCCAVRVEMCCRCSRCCYFLFFSFAFSFVFATLTVLSVCLSIISLFFSR